MQNLYLRGILKNLHKFFKYSYILLYSIFKIKNIVRINIFLSFYIKLFFQNFSTFFKKFIFRRVLFSSKLANKILKFNFVVIFVVLLFLFFSSLVFFILDCNLIYFLDYFYVSVKFFHLFLFYYILILFSLKKTLQIVK